MYSTNITIIINLNLLLVKLSSASIDKWDIEIYNLYQISNRYFYRMCDVNFYVLLWCALLYQAKLQLYMHSHTSELIHFIISHI